MKTTIWKIIRKLKKKKSHEIKKKFKKESKIFQKGGACDNMEISVDCLPRRIICYLQKYFQYRLVYIAANLIEKIIGVILRNW